LFEKIFTMTMIQQDDPQPTTTNTALVVVSSLNVHKNPESIVTTTTMDSNVEMVETKRRAMGTFDDNVDDDDDDDIVAADDLRNHEARGEPPVRPSAADETFSNEITPHPEVLYRNHRGCLLALLAVLLGLAFVVGSFYIENEPVQHQGDGESLFGGEMGGNGQQQQPAIPNINKVLQATGVLPSAKHQGKDWAKHHANKQHWSSAPTSGTDGASDNSDPLNPSQDQQIDQQQKEQEVINWQQAAVSFDDGKKYEIVKQIAHDRGAFTYVLKKS
jgi:hypothetical protein